MIIKLEIIIIIIVHFEIIKKIHFHIDIFIYIVVFKWVEGECLFDHWNFDKYSKFPELKSPKEKFFILPSEKKIQVVNVLFSFFNVLVKKGYVAVDFYDGSIMYDFDKDVTTICDIDFFKKAPIVNNIRENWFGTKRLKAPEEYEKGSPIDEITNVFTLGALIFDFFGYFSNEDIQSRYTNNKFIPCSISNWSLNESSYNVVNKAVNQNRSKRFKSIDEFQLSWLKCF
jgi:serine/threonine-protein kinase